MNALAARMRVADAARAAVRAHLDRAAGPRIPVVARSVIVASVSGHRGTAVASPAARTAGRAGASDRLAIVGVLPIAAAFFERIIALPEEVVRSVVACVEPDCGAQ